MTQQKNEYGVNIFNVGDKVRCINDANSDLILGDTYTVYRTVDASNEDNGQMLTLKEITGGCFSRRFELVEPRFNIGDKVVCTTSVYPINFPTGTVGTISCVLEDGYDVTNESTVDWFLADRQVEAYVEPVAEEPTFALWELVDEAPEPVIKPTVFITYGGVTISLDPNIATSRMFADAVLELAYA